VANRVDSIRISSFRGATTPLTLRFKSHPVILIFGENGTGKSTVADAFGFLCNREESGALSGYSITSPSRYVPSLGKTASAIHVELVSDAAPVTRERFKTNFFTGVSFNVNFIKTIFAGK